MSETSGLVSGVAGRYATALFELADEQGAIDAVSKDVSALREAMTDHGELKAALRDPSISRADMGKAMAALGAKLGLSTLTSSLVGVMAAARRLGSLGETLAAFDALAAAKRGEMTVEVVAAAELTDAQAEALRASLAKAAGKTIHMRVSVDPTLIGGLVVKMGSKMIDASLRSKLTSLQQKMKEVG